MRQLNENLGDRAGGATEVNHNVSIHATDLDSFERMVRNPQRARAMAQGRSGRARGRWGPIRAAWSTGMNVGPALAMME